MAVASPRFEWSRTGISTGVESGRIRFALANATVTGGTTARGRERSPKGRIHPAVDYGLDERDFDPLRRLEVECRAKRRRGAGRVVNDLASIGARIAADEPMGLGVAGPSRNFDLHDS